MDRAARRQHTVLRHLAGSIDNGAPHAVGTASTDYVAHYGPNKFKQAILERKKQIGMWSGLGSSLAADVLADSGFDVRERDH